MNPIDNRPLLIKRIKGWLSAYGISWISFTILTILWAEFFPSAQVNLIFALLFISVFLAFIVMYFYLSKPSFLFCLINLSVFTVSGFLFYYILIFLNLIDYFLDVVIIFLLGGLLVEYFAFTGLVLLFFRLLNKEIRLLYSFIAALPLTILAVYVLIGSGVLSGEDLFFFLTTMLSFYTPALLVGFLFLLLYHYRLEAQGSRA